MSVQLDVPEKLLPFFTQRARFKVAYGGRGGAKSWSIARMLVIKAYTERNHLILCTREFQKSISDSVHALLKSQIEELGLGPWFEVQEQKIICHLTGSRFIFKGLRHNINEIKSTEGVTICWVEEAQAVSESSWLVLIPTIRAANSEIWVSFNPAEDDDPTYKRFVRAQRQDMISIKINWDDNPWFTPELEAERVFMLQHDPDAYDWVWEGNTRKVSAATIFRGRFRLDILDVPEGLRPYFGADWGFSTDPTALVRFWRLPRPDGRHILYIDREAYGIGVELDDIPALFAGGVSLKTGAIYRGIEGAKDWPIKADSARPETISYIRGKQFNISAAKKWPGSVEDGIEYLKAYEEIVIHPDCAHMAQEARLYSYKVDRLTGDILPDIVDAHNHCWDAVRYGHDGLITSSGARGVWEKLAAKQGT